MMTVPAECCSCGTGRAEAPRPGCSFHIHHDHWFRSVVEEDADEYPCLDPVKCGAACMGACYFW